MRYFAGYALLLCTANWALLPTEQATRQVAQHSSNEGFQSLCADYLNLLKAHQALHNRLLGGSGINGFATPEEAEIMKGIAAWDAACQSPNGPVTAAPALPGMLGTHSQTINDIYANAWQAYQAAGATMNVVTTQATSSTPQAGSPPQPSGKAPPPPNQPGVSTTPQPATNGIPSTAQPSTQPTPFSPTVGGTAGGPPPPPPPPPPPAKKAVPPAPKNTSPVPPGIQGPSPTQQPTSSGGADLDGIKKAAELKAKTPLRDVKLSQFATSIPDINDAKRYLKMYPLYKMGEPIPSGMGAFDENAAKVLGAYLVLALSKVSNDESLKARLKRFQSDNANLDTYYTEYNRTKLSDPFKTLLAKRRKGIEGEQSDSDDDEVPQATNPQPQPKAAANDWDSDEEDDFEDVPQDLRTGLYPIAFKGVCKKLKKQGIVWGKISEEDFRKAFANARPKTQQPIKPPVRQSSFSDSDDEGTTVTVTTAASTITTPSIPVVNSPIAAQSGNNPYSGLIVNIDKIPVDLNSDPAFGLLKKDNLSLDELDQLKAFVKTHLDNVMPAVPLKKRGEFRKLVES